MFKEHIRFGTQLIVHNNMKLECFSNKTINSYYIYAFVGHQFHLKENGKKFTLTEMILSNIFISHTWSYLISFLTLILPIFSYPENVSVLLCQLHIFKDTQEKHFYHGNKLYESTSDSS